MPNLLGIVEKSGHIDTRSGRHLIEEKGLHIFGVWGQVTDHPIGICRAERKMAVFRQAVFTQNGNLIALVCINMIMGASGTMAPGHRMLIIQPEIVGKTMFTLVFYNGFFDDIRIQCGERVGAHGVIKDVNIPAFGTCRNQAI